MWVAAKAVVDMEVEAACHLQMPCAAQELSPQQWPTWYHTKEALHSSRPPLVDVHNATTPIFLTSTNSTTIGMCASVAGLMLKTGTHLARAHSKSGITKIHTHGTMHSSLTKRGTICAQKGCTSQSYHSVGGTPASVGQRV